MLYAIGIVCCMLQGLCVVCYRDCVLYAIRLCVVCYKDCVLYAIGIVCCMP